MRLYHLKLLRNFFRQLLPQSKRHLITGSICGVKLTEIKNLQEFASDKLVDELAKGSLWKGNKVKLFKLRLRHLALSLFLYDNSSKQINCLVLFDSGIIVKLILLSNNKYRYFIKKEEIQWQNLFEYCFIINTFPSKTLSNLRLTTWLFVSQSV
ncbi:MAG: DUF2200 family protein [Streptococcus sp.]